MWACVCSRETFSDGLHTLLDAGSDERRTTERTDVQSLRSLLQRMPVSMSYRSPGSVYRSPPKSSSISPSSRAVATGAYASSARPASPSNPSAAVRQWSGMYYDERSSHIEQSEAAALAAGHVGDSRAQGLSSWGEPSARVRNRWDEKYFEQALEEAGGKGRTIPSTAWVEGSTKGWLSRQQSEESRAIAAAAKAREEGARARSPPSPFRSNGTQLYSQRAAMSERKAIDWGSARLDWRADASNGPLANVERSSSSGNAQQQQQQQPPHAYHYLQGTQRGYPRSGDPFLHESSRGVQSGTRRDAPHGGGAIWSWTNHAGVGVHASNTTTAPTASARPSSPKRGGGATSSQHIPDALRLNDRQRAARAEELHRKLGIDEVHIQTGYVDPTPPAVSPWPHGGRHTASVATEFQSHRLGGGAGEGGPRREVRPF